MVDPSSLFDVQVKRIHEYKRQLLNVLHAVTRYPRIRARPNADWVPRTIVFAGKAASSYATAKSIIRLIHDVGRVVNNDPRMRGLLKVVFVPNYGVSVAEIVMPGADLSEQISTAGTEASGTGNMKLALERRADHRHRRRRQHRDPPERGRRQHLHLRFAHAEVQALRAAGYRPMRHYEANPALKAALDAIADGTFSPEEPGRYRGLVDTLLWGGDH